MRNPVKLVRSVLIVALVFFGLAHILSIILEFNGASPEMRYWTRLFDLDQEYNVTTLYNWLMLALSGALAVVLFLRERSIWWIGLSVLFIYLSLDEALLIHEQVAEPLRRDLALTNASPFFHAWVIPAIALTLLLGMYLLIAAKRNLAANKDANKIMYYVFLLAVGSIIIEILGTKTYNNIVFYRFVTVMVEEIYEMGFSSFILYNMIVILRSADQKHSKQLLKD